MRIKDAIGKRVVAESDGKTVEGIAETHSRGCIIVRDDSGNLHVVYASDAKLVDEARKEGGA